MKRITTILTIALICGSLSCPSIDARGRNNAGNGSPTQQHAPAQNNQRPGHQGGNNQRPGHQGGNHQRPGNQGGNNQRPGNQGGNNQRPGHQGGNLQRPGHQGGNLQRPGNMPGHNQPGHQPGHQPSHQPGHQPVPSHGFGPGHGHGHGPNHGFGHIPQHAPYRPTLPPPRPWARPVPPPSFRPGPRYPIISTILGVSLGSAINITLNYLWDNGYHIQGYTNDAVYLNNVRQLGLLWPNATLYYHGGRLAASEFVYCTPYYDANRYYQVYNSLTEAYGLPVSRDNLPGGGFGCSWFGYDGQYVTLQYQNAYGADGTSRYYTTLSFGN